MEKVNFKERRSQTKLLGAVIAAGGAILNCLYNGPAIAGSVLVEYPSPLAIILIISFLGAIMNVGVALGLEFKHPASWIIGWNGIIVSGLMAYIISALTQIKGPVFVAVFSPTSMVLVMVIGFIALGESIHVGRF
ncbi:WAT1-related protein At4g08290-like [Impatiens glandulifera]|uniref:WAT1-related protein At4g08290-like n=1 Tax=Impatiens glandulifera TaxID=253017 RepID=UPI001FB096D1|nr:WAT1-related protein At4g08290-like [Impatiens glandulifera]